MPDREDPPSEAPEPRFRKRRREHFNGGRTFLWKTDSHFGFVLAFVPIPPDDDSVFADKHEAIA